MRSDHVECGLREHFVRGRLGLDPVPPEADHLEQDLPGPAHGFPLKASEEMLLFRLAPWFCYVQESLVRVAEGPLEPLDLLGLI